MTGDLLDDDQLAYQRTVSSLNDELLDRIPRPDESLPEVSSDPSWCVCEMPEGDFPRIRIFSEFNDMICHLAGLDGQEVSAWVFFGCPITFTSKDHNGYRYLLTSSSECHCIRAGDEPLAVTPEEIRHLEMREDGWLGDPELTESSSESYYLAEGPRDDEFDPDEDIDGESLGI